MTAHLSLLCFVVGLASISYWLRATSLLRQSRDKQIVRELWPVACTFWAALTLADLFAVQSGAAIARSARAIELSASLLTAVPVLLAPRAVRGVTASLVITGLAVLALADLLFYRQFGSVLPVALWSRLNDAWWARATWLAMLEPRHLVYPILCLSAWVLPIAYRGLQFDASSWKSISAPWVVIALAVTPAIRSTYAHAEARDPLALVSPRSALQGGIWAAHLIDLWRRLSIRSPSLSRPQVDSVRAELERRRRAEIAKPVRKDNVLLLQVEAFNAWLLDVTVDGRPVMPNALRLRERGALFRLLDQTAIGRSSDADLLALCSVHPLPTVPASIARPENRPVALPGLLRDRGWTTRSISCDSPDLWLGGRRSLLYGIDHAEFGPDLGSPSTPQCDRVLFDRLARVIESAERPFFIWAVTLSMHSPHGPHPAIEPIAAGELAGTRLGGLIDLAHDTDAHLGRFLQWLEDRELLADTLIAIYGDHTETTMLEPELLARIVPDSTKADPLWSYRVPLIVVAEGAPTGENRAAAGLIDVAPTVLRLLGMPIPRVFLGRSLFEYPDGIACRWDGTALDDALTWRRGVCREARGGPLPAERCSYLARAAEAEISLSSLMTLTDSFRELASLPP